jgi:glutathione peroxidase
MMKYVRPGYGFVPKFQIMSKINVNGHSAHPLWKWMRESRPIPQDCLGDTKDNGCDDNQVLILPRSAFDKTTVTLWSPVTRNDVAWNFEKFLIDSNGYVFKRYSRFFPTSRITQDIEVLLAHDYNSDDTESTETNDITGSGRTDSDNNSNSESINSSSCDGGSDINS